MTSSDETVTVGVGFWDSGEPNLSAGKCVGLQSERKYDSTYHWMYRNCDEKRAYACRIDAVLDGKQLFYSESLTGTVIRYLYCNCLTPGY